ncbi:phage major capsid protein [Lachnospiraceae bacterium 50-23]
MIKRKFLDLQMFAGETSVTRADADALIPAPESHEIIQGVIAQSAVLQRGRKLANMTAAQYKMPVLDLLPVAYFVNGEGGSARKKITKMAWDKKVIYAEEIAVIVPISEAVLDDAAYDIWGEVKPRLIEAFGQKIDGAVLFGTEKPATWRKDVVTTAADAGAYVKLESDLYDSILGESGVIAKVEESGYFVNGHMADISMRAKLRGLKDTTGQPVFKSDMQTGTAYTLDGSPMNFPNNGAFDRSKALMISGDFSQLVYSIRQDITFKIFDQGVIQDPATGEIIYNLMQNDMVALRAVMRLGWEIPNPINAMVQDKTKRCPFSILATADPVKSRYTQDELEALTVDQIKALAGQKGYEITKTTKAEIIAEFLAAQTV